MLKSNNVDQSIRVLSNIKSQLIIYKNGSINLVDNKTFQNSKVSFMLDYFVIGLEKQ
jgi:hypothetical protein